MCLIYPDFSRVIYFLPKPVVSKSQDIPSLLHVVSDLYNKNIKAFLDIEH